MNTHRRAFVSVLMVCAALRPSYAGAWSHESFEKDGALDWVLDFQPQPTPEFVQRTLAAATVGKVIESFTGESAIAAAEVVAAALGRSTPGLPKELLPAIAKSRKQFASLALLARSALLRVLGEGSELRENWGIREESLVRWDRSVRELLARLSAPGANPSIERTHNGEASLRSAHVES